MKIRFKIKIYLTRLILKKKYFYCYSYSPRSYNLLKSNKYSEYKFDLAELKTRYKGDSFYNEIKKTIINQKIFKSVSFKLLTSFKNNDNSHSIFVNNCLLIDKVIDKPKELKFFEIIKIFKKLPLFLNLVDPKGFEKNFNCSNYNFIKKDIKFHHKEKLIYLSTPQNYGHFLEETIPSLGMFLEKYKENINNVFYFSGLKKYHIELLELFFPNLNYKSLETEINYIIKNSTLLPSIPSLFTIPWLDQFCSRKFNQGNQIKKIFCGRGDRISNFIEIKEYLLNNDFYYLDPYESVKKIQKYLSSAHLVIFTPGAEQANICFTPLKCQIYLLSSHFIFKQQEFKNCFPTIYFRKRKIEIIFEKNKINEKKSINNYNYYLKENPHTYDLNDLPIH